MRYRGVWIALGVAVLLTIGFWFLLYQPSTEEEAALQAEALTFEQQAQALRTQIAELEAIREQEVEIRATLARLEQLIPSGTAQAAAIREFQEAADAAGVDINAVAFDEPLPFAGAPPTGEPGTMLANVPTTMTVVGGYFQVVDFFRRLEVDVPRAVLVTDVSIEEAEVGYPTLNVTWQGQIFAIVPVPPPAAGATPSPGATPAPGATPSPTPGAPATPAAAGAVQAQATTGTVAG